MTPALRAAALLVPLALAGGVAWLLAEPKPAPLPASVPSQAFAPAAPVVSRPASPGVAQPGTAPAGVAPAATAPRLPGFDVVRVGPRGNLVVAGRAEAEAEVALREGGRELARARADRRGDWVILPEAALAPGAYELSLRATLPDGRVIDGADTVLVRVPEPLLAAAEAQSPGAAANPTAPVGQTFAGTAPGTGGGTAAGATAGATHGTATADPAKQALVLLLPGSPAAPPRSLGAAPAAGSRTPQAAALGVDVLDYDEAGAMRFSGTAPPGTQLRLYADEKPLGEAQADSTGRWTLQPDPAPAEGRHTLRVDQIAPGGSVAARVAVPFQREILPPGAVRDGQVVVQPGNNLWRLARAAYGQGVRYTVIFAANRGQIRDPARIYPGQVLGVPQADPSTPAAASRSR